MTHFLDTLAVNSLPAIRAGTAGLLSDSYYVETPVHGASRRRASSRRRSLGASR